MSNPKHTKTMRSLVEAANSIDRATIDEGRGSQHPSNAAKIDYMKDFKKRVKSYFNSMGTAVYITVSPAESPTGIVSIQINVRDRQGDIKFCNFMRIMGKWTVNYSGVRLGDTPVETASKQIRDQAEYFVNLSQAVGKTVALLTDFYDVDPFSP